LFRTSFVRIDVRRRRIVITIAVISFVFIIIGALNGLIVLWRHIAGGIVVVIIIIARCGIRQWHSVYWVLRGTDRRSCWRLVFVV
jgi:hypothetical protein